LDFYLRGDFLKSGLNQGYFAILGYLVKRAIRRFSTKEEGVKVSSGLVRSKGNSQLKIYKVDGKIQEERTYGEDPRRTKG